MALTKSNRTCRVRAFVKLSACAVGLALVVTSQPVAAEPDCQTRVEFLQRTLTREASRAQTWSRVWSIGLAAATVGQLTAIPFVDDGDRVDFYVGSVSSVVGVVALVAAPLSVSKDGPRFARHTAAGRDPCLLVKEGELMLKRGVDSEAAGTGVLGHVGNVAFNLGIGLILGWGFGHWESGIINAVAGVAVGETLILTQPTGLASALERYRAGDFAQRSQQRRIGWALAPRGFSVSFTF